VKDRLRDLNVTSPQMQQNASDEFTHFLGILMVEQTLRTSETITHCDLASNLLRTVSHMSMTRHMTFGLLHHVQTTSYRPPVTHIRRRVRSQSDATQKVWMIEKFWKHIQIQRPKINQKQTFSLMGQNLC